MAEIECKRLTGKEISNIDEYISSGGFEALKKALSMSSEEIIEEIKRSGLRGRGGAGFPTGIKWENIYNDSTPKKYVCCNAAEGEPGTFKDRYIIRKNPYQVIEGIAIAAYAMKAARSFIGIKVTFEKEREALRKAIEECQEHGFIGKNVLGSSFDIPVEIRVGPDDYLFGEETAFMRVLEGGPCMPRMKPSFIVGLGNGMKIEPEDDIYVNGVPTLLNNLETLANIPHIIRNGAKWFREVGTERSPGTLVFTLSGDVKNPGMYELPLGTRLSTLINDLGGGAIHDKVKGVLPGGPSNRILTGQEIDISLDYDSLRRAGSGIGSGCVIVYDETACMVHVALTFAVFFMKASCGQCAMCSRGTHRLAELMAFIEHGRGKENDISEIWSWVPEMTKPDAGRCYLVAAQPIVVSSIMHKFPEEFVAHLEKEKCPFRRTLPSFKILDFDEKTREFTMAHL